jgi:uncharacterized damage-inducible protein DinB
MLKKRNEMERTIFLATRLKEVILDGRWIANTNYKDQLMHVTMEQATTKIGSLNTIAALTYHINYYLAGILNVFNGGELEIRDKYSFHLPPIASEADWKRLRDELLVNSERFIQAVATMTDAQLDQPFVDEKYGTYARNIEGVIEHSYYHLGQISLIRKMV